MRALLAAFRSRHESLVLTLAPSDSSYISLRQSKYRHVFAEKVSISLASSN
jgi:hypothetical protein